jgi:alkylation response protein AidB-like acyl-CoA dehydrogenase
MTSSVPADIWAEAQTLRPIVEACRAETDRLRRLPDPIAQAFVDRDIYRLLLPVDLGGRGIDPLAQFDLAEEISSYDGSVGWNYAIGSNSGTLGGVFPREIVLKLFASPGLAVAGSGPPQGRAVETDGGYRVTGRFAWASGVHQASWVVGGCFVFEGDQRKAGPNGGPMVVHVLAPKGEARVLDTWQTGGMRGTGSTEVVLEDVFIPRAHVFSMFGGQPYHDAPIYRLPTSVFGFALTAVPLGIARHTISALKQLALAKKPPPPRLSLAEQGFTQYTVAKAEAMTEAAKLAVRAAFSELWREVLKDGQASMASRARLRRASVHAVETSVEAVGMCCRAAGGDALFENQPFERALRDVNAAAGHVVFQRAMMEDCGRVDMGLPPLLPMF